MKGGINLSNLSTQGATAATTAFNQVASAATNTSTPAAINTSTPAAINTATPVATTASTPSAINTATTASTPSAINTATTQGASAATTSETKLDILDSDKSSTQTLDETISKEDDTWFSKIKPFITIKNSIISFIIMGIGVALYFFSSIIIKKIFKEGFGEDTKEENSKKVKIDEVERQLQDRITSINTNLTSLKKRMDDADIVKDNKPTNLAIAIQNNILAVKEAMMKIIAGLVIQTKMNNGAINVVSQTNAFQKNMTDSINNLTNPK